MNQGTDLALKELQAFVDGDSPLSRVSAALVVAELKRRDEIIQTLDQSVILRGIEISELKRAIESKLDSDKLNKVEKRRRGATQKLRRLIGINAD